jgi:outer membrane protein OmpA-like peptidoglycan-associated protein
VELFDQPNGQDTDLHPGNYTLTASAPGFRPNSATRLLVADDVTDVTVVLEPDLRPGELVVTIIGDLGGALSSSLLVDGQELFSPTGEFSVELEEGPQAIEARSDGYATETRDIAIAASETNTQVFQLWPSRATLTDERIDLQGTVYFETNRSMILEESFSLLDEVAQVMKEHPEVLLLRIEGHTDNRGSESYNNELSKRRAAAVRDYLIADGIDPDRLASDGYGETHPANPAELPEAWSQNRRVEFLIQRWRSVRRVDPARSPSQSPG